MSNPAVFRFRLYVAHDTANSTLALANLNALCRTHLPGRHEIEVVNVYRDRQRALAEGVLMTPTLLKLAPLPVQTIVGTLARTELVLQVLGMEDQAA